VRRSIITHLRGSLVGYLALFIALGGSSYAAVQLKPGSVRTRALANGSVTHSKLRRGSVDTTDVANGSLTAADFKAGSIAAAVRGPIVHDGPQGVPGPTGAAGDQGPAGHNGTASIALRARQSAPVTAAHGASTPVALDGSSWTQAAGELDLVTGSLTVHVPASCTGSFGNTLTISVDGATNTFGVAPTTPAGGTVTVPFVVGTLTEPTVDTPHRLAAQVGNSCTKDGEDYAVSGVKVDVLAFH
jgi:hypothetical protein